MKKIIAALIAIVCLPCSLFAVDFEISGEVKTGFYTEQQDIQGKVTSQSKIHNNDEDSGKQEGRVRLNLNIAYENIGMRTRYTQQVWGVGNFFAIEFMYAYADLFNEQLKISAGTLGESPWGTGGPDLFEYVDNTLGIRTEWKPNFLPGLNLGFVLNRPDYGKAPGSEDKTEFLDMLQESVLGIAYDHEYFAFRFSYRFDSEWDWSLNAGNEGAQFVYRVEERLLGKLLPGMQIFANGRFYGIFNEKKDAQLDTGSVNWLYMEYSPENFTVNLNTCYTTVEARNTEPRKQVLFLKPGFTYKLFDNFLNLIIKFGMEIPLENKKNYEDSFYNYWYVEPQVKININSNSYVAVVYNFKYQYENFKGDISKTNWVNIRVVYTF